ncbi:MAG: NADH-quinone oxidoreductase subunit [Gammaproteobacteria bacterium]|jgi:NADH-quinone oxidoreductase subunit A|nr:NADH-quinone oxidoreductase subunit [Gammaproteobacteria bacterium]
MTGYLSAYFSILVFIGIGIVVGLVPILAGHLIGKKKPNPIKDSAYECGFPAFENARLPFDVRFYLVAILFILFDLETAFLFPWAVTLRTTKIAGLVAMAIFVGVLVLGFIYEWRKGALEWE